MVQALQLLLSLSILIVLHEMGHFIPARLFRTRVEKFYLFFDPWFSLFKIKKGDTEYGIGWLPLGGYVKISGMIDESMDKEQMKQPAQPWEFRSKPAWQRLVIMVGGVTVNLLLGILIYVAVIFAWGKEYLPTENLKYGIECDSLALKMGLKNGDKIVSVDGEKVKNFQRIPIKIILDKAKSIQVERNGEVKNVTIDEEYLSRLIKAQKNFIYPRFPCVVDSILPKMPAEKIGLRKGDSITEINGVRVKFFDEVTGNFQKNKSKNIPIKIRRGAEEIVLNTDVDSSGKIGFAPKTPDKILVFKKERFSFLESFPEGARQAYEAVVMQIKQLGVLFTVKDAHKSLGGFISIGKAYGEKWDWQQFWTFTAFLSIVLAFMNILPIPALDGGHVIFLLYEVITGRKPHEKVLEYAQYAGMLLLLSLLLYANGNDIVRLFAKH